MKPAGQWRWPLPCLGVICLGVAQAHAQTPPQSSAPTPTPYEDRVLDEGPQSAALQLDTELRSTAGWPRGWRIEYTTSLDRGDQRQNAHGIALSSYLDTPNHGGLSLNLAINRSDSSGVGGAQDQQSLHSWRLDQQALPLNGGWLANHAAGHLSTLQAPLARGSGRIGLPSSPMEGVTGLYSRGTDLQYNVSLGRPGLYSGQSINGFASTRGNLSSIGFQQMQRSSTGSANSFAAQAIAVNGTGISSASTAQATRALWGAWRWQGQAPWAQRVAPGTAPMGQRDGGLDVQFNLLTNPSFGHGAWGDAQWRNGWLEQQAGVFYLEPDLRWGTYNAVSDLRGLYWRGETGTRQWQLSGSAEMADSVSGRSPNSFFASLTGRYRLDTTQTLTGNLSVRRISSPGESIQFAWDYPWDAGRTQWRFDIVRGLINRAARVGADHSFDLASGSLAISLALERVRDMGVQSQAVSWGVVGSLHVGSGISLDANLRGNQSSRSRLVNGNLGATWTINPNWSLVAQFNSTRGEDSQPFSVVSALSDATAAAAPRPFEAQRVQMTLRFQDRAGSASAPLGGKPGTGAGSLSGVVYYDGNDNGRREASEAGVPDVTIRLNGRFVTRTDQQGHYEFPAVAAGLQRLEIVSDNVPLPWSPVATKPLPVEVLVRSATTLDFPVRRDR